jgi:hypothetical protein
MRSFESNNVLEHDVCNYLKNVRKIINMWVFWVKNAVKDYDFVPLQLPFLLALTTKNHLSN